MVIEANGAKVYVEQHGEAGPDILLLHGWGCTSALWAPITQALARRARVTVIDFPGHGSSGRPPVPWGTEDFARMVADLADALEIRRWDIIGHSHGGRVALQVALDSPALVNRLVLTGAAGLRAAPTAAQQKRAAAYKRLRGLSGAMERMRIFGPLPQAFRERLRQRYGSADYNALDEEMRKTFVRLVNTDLTEALPRVRASTLLLWGSEDTETPLWMGKTMEAQIPDAGLVVLQGGSHYAHLEKLNEFLVITEQFLLGGPA